MALSLPHELQSQLIHGLAKEIEVVKKNIYATGFALNFEQSHLSGTLPTDWKQSNVTPIFKEGSKLQDTNYRPVYLKCFPCKLFEHVCKHMFDYLETHNNLQHG